MRRESCTLLLLFVSAIAGASAATAQPADSRAQAALVADFVNIVRQVFSPSPEVEAFARGEVLMPFSTPLSIIKKAGFSTTCIETRLTEQTTAFPRTASFRRDIRQQVALNGTTRVYRAIYWRDSELPHDGDGKTPLYQFIFRLAADGKLEDVDTDFAPILTSSEVGRLYRRALNPSFFPVDDPSNVVHGVVAFNDDSVLQHLAEAEVEELGAPGAVKQWTGTRKGSGIVAHHFGASLQTEDMDEGDIVAAGKTFKFRYYLRRLYHLESGLLIQSSLVRTLTVEGTLQPSVFEAIRCSNPERGPA